MIDVILPVKDRPEVESSVQSLFACPQIARLLICDGGSQSACSRVLAELQQLPNVEVLSLPHNGFDKAYLMNRGILETTAKWILMSDADIVWNELALQQLQKSVNENRIASVDQVEETDAETVAIRRDRYSYDIIKNDHSVILEIQPVTQKSYRPGCGLLLAERTTLLRLRGYKQIFQGWGWEDQDLLIRAQLLGIQVTTAGQVLHLSHTDRQRNSFHRHAPPSATRNDNLLAAIASLLQHRFWGDLPPFPHAFVPPQTLQVSLPPALRQWLYESPCEGIPAHDLSWARNAFAHTDRVVATATDSAAGRRGSTAD